MRRIRTYYIRLQHETVAAEDSETIAFAYPAAGEEPNSYWQAVKGPGGSFWKDVADKEYDSLVSNNTWELVTPPPGAPIIGSMWRFKVKRIELGQILKCKARLYMPEEISRLWASTTTRCSPPPYGTSQYAHYSHWHVRTTSKWTSLDQFDVITAFLNANVQETILMSHSEAVLPNDE